MQEQPVYVYAILVVPDIIIKLRLLPPNITCSLASQYKGVPIVIQPILNIQKLDCWACTKVLTVLFKGILIPKNTLTATFPSDFIIYENKLHVTQGLPEGK